MRQVRSCKYGIVTSTAVPDPAKAELKGEIFTLWACVALPDELNAGMFNECECAPAPLMDKV